MTIYTLVLSLLLSQSASLGSQRPGSVLRDADDLQVISPSSAPQLNQPYALGLHFRKASLDHIIVRQRLHPDGPLGSQIIPDAEQNLSVLRKLDGESYISVIPRRLGKVEFELWGTFSDGGVLVTRLYLFVEPSAAPIARLDVRTFVAVSLEHPYKVPLGPTAFYSGSKEGLELDPHFVRFSIKTHEKHSPASVDPQTGSVTPIAPGHALIETSYGGLKRETCVIVTETELQLQREHSVCSELFENGETLIHRR